MTCITYHLLDDDQWTSKPLVLADVRDTLESYVRECVGGDAESGSQAAETTLHHALAAIRGGTSCDLGVLKGVVEMVNEILGSGSNGLVLRESDL